jgi:hypothetical protein
MNADYRNGTQIFLLYFIFYVSGGVEIIPLLPNSNTSPKAGTSFTLYCS